MPRTPVTDDELLLLDAFFDVDDTLESLRRDHYEAWRNLPYTHGLDDAALERAVARVLAAGLLRRRPQAAPRAGRPPARLATATWVGLTAAGGALWSRARRARWTRYCSDASRPGGAAGRWVLSVQSPSLATARAFLAAAVECGVYAADPSARVGGGSGISREVRWPDAGDSTLWGVAPGGVTRD